MNRLKVFLLIIFAAILLPRIYQVIRFLDIGETVIPHAPGPCQQVKGANAGSEDMELVPGTDVALISTGLRFGDTTSFPDRKGNILYFDFNKPSEGAKPMTIKGFKKSLVDFNPHGISIYGKSKFKVLLFVVNHDKDGDVVEKFSVDISTFTLTFIATLADRAVFRVLNDITATGENSFYYTNYMYYTAGSFLGNVETFGSIRLASVGYFDDTKAVAVISNLLLPNGISQSPDGKFVYLANIGDEEIVTYERQQDNSLLEVEHTRIESALDNIFVDPVTGDLWLGCHPVVYKMVHYLSHQASSTSPSQVLHVKTKNGIPTNHVREIYVDSGENVSASSIAVYHKNILLVGSISHKAVYCNVKYLD